MMATNTEVENDDAPVVEERHGFLPIYTNTFDRWFISIVCLIALHLLWMRFLEAYLPIEIATIISLVWAFVVIRWG
jgi:predicted small integral membrane protein